MQQLFSAFGIDWRLLIAQAVNFGIVLVALRYFLYSPVMRMLEERRRVVAKGVEDAQEAAGKLAVADASATERVRAGEMEAEEIIKTARAAASLNKAQMLREAEARAIQVAQDAEARAAELAARVRRESEKDIARLALLAAEKVMRNAS